MTEDVNYSGEIKVRRAARSDGEHIWRVHTAAIKGSCGDRYTVEEIDAWTSRLSPDSYDAQIRGKALYVAQDDEQVVGFGQLDVVSGEVEAVYVLPDQAGRGIGGLLLRTLEDVARECGVKRLHLDSSLNAVGFYEHEGYVVRGETWRAMQSDVSLPCIRMEKTLKA